MLFTSRQRMVSTALDQDQLWREEYRAHRYLEFATPEVLQQRLIDITENSFVIDRYGKFSTRPDATEWLRLITHINEEIVLRNIEVQVPIPPTYFNAARAAQLWDPLNLPYGSYLLKFGKRQHIFPLFTKGLIRVSPAETYNDAKLGDAVADNEREFMQESIGATVSLPPNRDYSLPRDQWITTSIIGTLKNTQTYTGQAYMACLSRKYDCRLFEDFGYDACVVIRDPLQFLKAMKEAGEALLPGFQFYFDAVSYRDPLQPRPEGDVLYTKHFRFTYQAEFRLTWEREPVAGEPPLQPIFFELGPLTDYCDYLVL